MSKSVVIKGKVNKWAINLDDQRAQRAARTEQAVIDEGPIDLTSATDAHRHTHSHTHTRAHKVDQALSFQDAQKDGSKYSDHWSFLSLPPL